MEISIIKIKIIVGALINWTRQNLIDNSATPEDSWLYHEFHDITIDGINFYDQLKSLIEQSTDDRRHLEVRLMFDRDRANLPTIHIHYPTEEGRSGDNTLNTGFLRNEEVNDAHNVPVYSRSFIGQYDLVVTGGNSLEVIMLYEFLDGILIAAADTLAYYFDKFEFSGKQLLANQELIPYLTYYRAIGLSLQAKKIVRSLINYKRAIDIRFAGTFYTDSQEPADLLPVVVTIEGEVLEGNVNDLLVFASSAIREGDQPVYKWSVTHNGNTYIADEVWNYFSYRFEESGIYTIQCELTSSIAYLLPRPAVSNILTITII